MPNHVVSTGKTLKQPRIQFKEVGFYYIERCRAVTILIIDYDNRIDLYDQNKDNILGAGYIITILFKKLN